MMNDRIIPQRPGPGAGKLRTSEPWEDLPARWAHVKFQTGSEAIRANADIAVVKASIRIRASQDIDSSMRIKFKQWVFEIKAPPLPDDRDSRFMFLLCEAVT